MPNCPMVYDSYGAGKEFKICKDPADRRPSSKSVLYLKNGKYIKVLITLPIFTIKINYQWYLNVYIFLDFESELYAEQKTCTTASVEKGRLDSVESCRAICKGVASMFSFGTNDHGGDLCNNNGCPCYCEHAQMVGGTCITTDDVKYNLYRYLNECMSVT